MKASEGEEANLSEVKVTALRLSSRSFGIATWSKNCTLAATLEQGSRGIVDMPELFGSAAGNSKDGGNTVDADELDILLEATNDRQIPAGCGEVCGDKGDRKGFLPLDAVLFGQTNDGSYERFIKEQADPDKFTRRLAIFNVPYITSVSEEEYAYRAEIAKMRDQPHFDPMVLKTTPRSTSSSVPACTMANSLRSNARRRRSLPLPPPRPTLPTRLATTVPRVVRRAHSRPPRR
jgi:hypothetical protein